MTKYMMNWRDWIQKRISSATAKDGEDGVALVAVLVVIFSAGMVLAVVMAMSQRLTIEMHGQLQLQRSNYTLEGAANRIVFLLAADRSVYPDSTPGDIDYSEYETDRYMSDAVEHTIDYYGTEIKFAIYDAVSGSDFSENGYSDSFTMLKAAELEESEYTELVDRVEAQVTDYIDSDDDLSTDGAEYAEYEENDMSPLPRNGPIQFREELAWVPEFSTLLGADADGRYTACRLIPPYDMDNLTGTPNFFTASPLLIEQYCNFDDDSYVQEVLEARQKWITERESLSDQLDVDVYNSIRENFSWEESGYYTVVIRDGSGSNRPSRRLSFSFPAIEIGGADDGVITYLEWFWF